MTCVYCVDNSTPNQPLIITIELLTETDLSSLHRKPLHFKCPFYQRGMINCGKIKHIENIGNTKEHYEASIFFNNDFHRVGLGQYINIKNYNYRMGNGIIVYLYKIAALEHTKYVHKDYTGIRYIHYSGGQLRKKSYYRHGQLLYAYLYRNDVFNTQEQYHKYGSHEWVMCAYFYDGSERYVGEAYYNEKGTVFTQFGKISELIQC